MCLSGVDKLPHISLKAGGLSVCLESSPSINFIHRCWLRTLNLFGSLFVRRLSWVSLISCFSVSCSLQNPPGGRAFRVFAVIWRLFTEKALWWSSFVKIQNCFRLCRKWKIRDWYNDTKSATEPTIRSCLRISASEGILIKKKTL